MRLTRISFCCGLFTVVALCCQSYAQSGPPLVLTKTLPLTGYAGSFDHFAFDAQRDRVLLAAEDHGTVEVFDLSTGAHLRTVSDFEKPHSILVRPGAATVLVTDSEASKSALLNASTYQVTKRLVLSLGANCLLYDAPKHRAYITAGGDRVRLQTSTLLAIDPDTGAVLKSVELPSLHLQPMALDPGSHRLFVNMPDKSTVAVLDTNSLHTIAEWKIVGAKGNSPIAFDRQHHRLFIVCSDSGVMVVLNSDTGVETYRIAVPTDADDMDFDSSAHRLYIPGGDGYLGIYDASVPDHIRQIMRIATRRGARTGLFIPKKHRYVLAAPANDGRAAQVMIYHAR